MDREEDGVRFVSSRWAPPEEAARGTDIAAIADGWVPITPLMLDQTAFPVLTDLIELDLKLPPPAVE